jgi:Family of unknown function (DUF6334)
VAEGRLATAEALDPMLGKFRRIDGEILRTVRRVRDEGCLVRVILDFGHIYLTIEARPEDDTIDLWTDEGATVARTGVDASKSEPWSSFVGKPFGWGWVTINQQGYCDGVLLSFDGITPRMMLNVVASSIDERELGQPL